MDQDLDKQLTKMQLKLFRPICDTKRHQVARVKEWRHEWIPVKLFVNGWSHYQSGASANGNLGTMFRKKQTKVSWEMISSMHVFDVAKKRKNSYYWNTSVPLMPSHTQPVIFPGVPFLEISSITYVNRAGENAGVLCKVTTKGRHFSQRIWTDKKHILSQQVATAIKDPPT